MTGRINRDLTVDGLRGLTLLVIVFTHYVPTSFFSLNIARPAAAVMLTVTGYYFMMIVERDSGFAGPVRDRAAAAARLFLQRHMRIWPTIAGVILLYVLLGYVDQGPTTTQIHHTWPLYLAYMGNVVKMLFEAEAFPAQFWLIAAQEQFVLLALAALVLVGRGRIKSVLMVAVVVGVVARIVGCWIWMPDQPALATESPFAIADAVGLGMLSRIGISAGESKTGLRRGFVAAAIATLLLAVILPNTFAVYFGLVPLLMALVGCIFIFHLADEVRVRRLQRSVLTSPVFVLLGQMSLSLFMLHPLVNTILNLAFAHYAREILPWWALSLVGPPLSLVVAYGYFRAVEVPIRRLRRRRAAAPQQVAREDRVALA